MTSWTRLVRFEDESGKVRLGQPVDASQDVGLACAAGEPVQVKLIEGDLFDGKVTENTAVVKKVSCSVSHPMRLGSMANLYSSDHPYPPTFPAARTRYSRAMQPHPLSRTQLQGCVDLYKPQLASFADALALRPSTQLMPQRLVSRSQRRRFCSSSQGLL